MFVSGLKMCTNEITIVGIFFVWNFEYGGAISFHMAQASAFEAAGFKDGIVAGEVPGLLAVLPHVVARGHTAGHAWTASRWVGGDRPSLVARRGVETRRRLAADTIAILQAHPTGTTALGWARSWADTADQLPQLIADDTAPAPAGGLFHREGRYDDHGRTVPVPLSVRLRSDNLDTLDELVGRHGARSRSHLVATALQPHLGGVVD